MTKSMSRALLDRCVAVGTRVAISRSTGERDRQHDAAEVECDCRELVQMAQAEVQARVDATNRALDEAYRLLAVANKETASTAAALEAEVERLARERDHFRDAWATAQVRLDCGADATEAVRKERAAVVAWLRAAANAPHPSELGAPMLSPSGRGLLLLHADFIERGEHRRKEVE